MKGMGSILGQEVELLLGAFSPFYGHQILLFCTDVPSLHRPKDDNSCHALKEEGVATTVRLFLAYGSVARFQQNLAASLPLKDMQAASLSRKGNCFIFCLLKYSPSIAPPFLKIGLQVG